MRMKIAPLSLLVAGAISLAVGYATIARADGEGQPSAVQVYELNPYVGRSYDIVGRLWIGSWRSALGVTTYPKREDAIVAMQTEASRLNADALVSVSCVDQHGSTWYQGSEPAFLCYGVAVKLRPNQG
jgi:uncharacterized protein YbjQ (UPF0145 family)